MPELKWRLGYPLAWSAMVVAILAVYYKLRKSGWL
jgi:magnesium transporter